MVDKHRPSLGVNPVGRRAYLLAGGAALTGLSGCLGDDEADDDPASGDDDDGDDDGTPPTTDAEFVNFMQENPATIQYNTFNDQGISNTVNEVIFDRLAGFNQQTDEWDALVAEDWSVEGETASLTISDAYTWHDGSELTSADLETQFRLGEYTAAPLWDFVESVTAVGDYELEFEVAGDVNNEVLLTHILSTHISAPDAVFGERLQAIDDAGDDEFDEVLAEELLEFEWEEPIGNGPFEFERATDQDVELTRYEDHPAADQLNFDEYRVRFVTLPEMTSMAVSGQVTGGSTANAVVKNKGEIPDSYDFVPVNGFNGDGHFFQFDHPAGGNRNFRKAYMHLVNQQEMNETIRPPGTKDINWRPHTLQTGMLEPQAEKYLDDVIDGFETYDGGEERAEELLLEGGFSQDDGSWIDPDGDPVELEMIIVEGNVSLSGQAEFAQERLQSFGIDLSMRTTDFASYFDAYVTGNYDMTIWLWGGGFENPYFHFADIFTNVAGPVGYPETIEVPKPVGEPDGDMEEVAPAELVAELGRTSDEEARELIQELAWIYNQTVPLLQGVDALWPSLIQREGWDWPEEGADELGVPPAPAWCPKIGAVNADP